MPADLARTESFLALTLVIVLLVVAAAAAVAYVLVRRAVRDKVESERLAAMGIASARILHQVKNPIATIVMQGGLLGEERTLDESTERRAAADEISAAATRVSALLADLSAYASGQTTQIAPVPTELAPLVEETVRAAIAAHPGGDPPALDLDGGLVVAADPHVLRQALDNVVGNALEAMNGSGRLRVRAARRGNDALITVEDEGPGIAPDQVRRVLEPFVTSKRSGMGLGIPVARDVVEAHGGRFELRSKLGEGTTVTMSIPLAG